MNNLCLILSKISYVLRYWKPLRPTQNTTIHLIFLGSTLDDTDINTCIEDGFLSEEEGIESLLLI